MSEIVPEQLRLRTDEELIIRTAAADDAEILLENARVILSGDLYNITTLDEFKITAGQERKLIKEHIEHAGRIILVAELGRVIAGSVRFGSRTVPASNLSTVAF